MPVPDLRVLIALTVSLAGLAALLLCLAAVDLARALCTRLWLLASPGAARRAHFRAALAAYRVSSAKRARKSR